MKNLIASVRSLKYLISLWILILLVWLLNWYLLGSSKDRGTFGDMFGGLNALFTGLAFATLIYTTWMQKEELALQREELAATRDELKGQKEQLQSQTKTFELQRFESSIFSLLNAHRDNLAAISFANHHGAESFSGLYSRFRSFYEEMPARAPAACADETVRINAAFKIMSENYLASFGHYSRHLYLVFNFINESKVENKELYADIFKAQLSSYELAFLFYFCLSDSGKLLKPLVEEHAILGSIYDSYLIKLSHKSLYRPTAFI